MYVKAMWWYLQEYGEDWAEIIREEDIREQKQQEEYNNQIDKIIKNANMPADWLSDGVNQ
jgi:hypothetical protein